MFFMLIFIAEFLQKNRFNCVINKSDTGGYICYFFNKCLAYKS